ncbi:MAG: DUF2860 family protein [Pseudomonadota bacterium]
MDSTLEDARTLGWRVFGRIDAGFGITVEPSIVISHKDFRNPNPLFTADPDERTVGFSLTLEKSDFFIANGFVPFAEITYQRTNTDIPAFRSEETTFLIGLSRQF